MGSRLVLFISFTVIVVQDFQREYGTFPQGWHYHWSQILSTCRVSALARAVTLARSSQPGPITLVWFGSA